MKPPLLIAFAVAFYVLCGCASRPQAIRNKVGANDAIKIASQLTYGMPENDVMRFLSQHGFTINNVPGAGDSFGWTHSFLLADGSYLSLQMTPEPLRPDGAWTNGRLRSAYIQRHGANAVKISLKEAS